MNVVEQHLAEIVALDELVRLRRYREAWEAYHGIFPASLRGLRGRDGRSSDQEPFDDNVVVNFARVVVDKGVAFLFGRAVEWEIDELRASPEEDWLRRCWVANGNVVPLQKLALNGGVCGHAFLKIVPRAPHPRLIVLDPANVAVGYDTGDIDDTWWYRIQYAAIDPLGGKPVTYRQLIERDGATWLITDQMARSGDQFRTLRSETWPYAWPPIIGCQNLPMPNEYYGISDLPDDVLRLNRTVNFVLSNLARIVRYHAHPKTWGRGFTANHLQVGIDETIVLPGTEAELRNLEMTSDLASSISLYERLREALHEVTQVPEVATGRLDRAGALSGVALSILYQPLLEKTENKRRTYGALIEEVNRRLLALGGFGEEHHTTLRWPELLPGDPKAEAEVALLHQQIGVSQDTILQELGYNAEMERQKRELDGEQLGEQLLTAFERGE